MLPEHLRVKLSKKMAGLLRHYGEEYGLKFTRDGWVRITDLVQALRRIPGFDWVTVQDVLEVVSRDEKGRYEVRDGMIRARYGHSIEVEVEYEELSREEIPETLYHGTVARRLEGILREGLKPMRRRYVHLSLTPQDAYTVGRRHGVDVVVLAVDTRCLEEKGIPVYRASHKVYVTPWVPPDCIRLARRG